jgi:positive regulator of sigma E activity
MLSEIGTVFKIEKGIAYIMINRKLACTGCHVCHHSEDGSHMITEAKDLIGASIGDVVRIESSSDVGPVKASLILYILPILLLIFGYFLGKLLFRSFGVNVSGETPGIISGFLLMGLAYLGIYLVAHSGKQREKAQFKVVEIIRKAETFQTGVEYDKVFR